MVHSTVIPAGFSARLIRRFFSYSAVGVGTFILDLMIIAALIYGVGAGYQLAVVVGFLVAITLNFFICYFIVYKGTRQSLLRGFLFFLLVAILGSLIIAYSVQALVEIYAMTVLFARTAVSVVVGLVNFFLNTFFNFKVF